jgi:hypothetical protein
LATPNYGYEKRQKELAKKKKKEEKLKHKAERKVGEDGTPDASDSDAAPESAESGSDTPAAT